MCKCLERRRSTSQLWKDFGDEVIELIKTPLDRKEWGDCGKGLEDLVERYLGVRLYLGSGLNRVIQRKRDEEYGCIRSFSKVVMNGGRCLSE